MPGAGLDLGDDTENKQDPGPAFSVGRQAMNKEIHSMLQSDKCWVEKSGRFRVERQWHAALQGGQRRFLEEVTLERRPR